jgi:Transcriptional regulator containing PAS, AAA-type ATPase, and DNA-binding domains
LIGSIWRGCAAETGITLADGVLPALASYEWPGNLRQLTGMLRTLIALAGPNGFIGMQDLPPAIRLRQPVAPAHASTGGTAISLAPISETLAGITEQAIRAAIEAPTATLPPRRAHSV